MLMASLRNTVLLVISVCLILFNGYLFASMYDQFKQYQANRSGYDEGISNQGIHAHPGLVSEHNGSGLETAENTDETMEGNLSTETEEAYDLPQERKAKAMIDTVSIRQHPELFNGCEITTLTMLLQSYGIDKNKMEMAAEMKRDETPLKEVNGKIISWGDPHVGFVGDVTGRKKGLGIYHEPLFPLLQQYIPSAVNLTGSSFEELERFVSNGFPVMVWTTISFVPPRENQWFTWDSPTGEVRATFQMHTVLLVGYDDQYVYVNDPETGEKQKRIDRDRFIETWEVFGKQALSYIKS